MSKRKRSSGSINLFPSIDELIQKRAVQLFGGGPVHGENLAREYRNGKRIPKRSLRQERWVCIPPSRFLGPPRRNHLDNKLSHANREYVKLETIRYVLSESGICDLENSMMLRRSCEPDLRSNGKRKVVPKRKARSAVVK